MQKVETLVLCLFAVLVTIYGFTNRFGRTVVQSEAQVASTNRSSRLLLAKVENNMIENHLPRERPHSWLRRHIPWKSFLSATVVSPCDVKVESKPLKVIIAGAPASGKGTQCEIIKSKYGLVHLSTGDILRAAVKEGTPLGIQAKKYMDSGKLVPDELIIGVVCDRLQQEDCRCRGWLLDGFPRTRAQAEALQNAGITADCFILLDVPESVLVERVEGRRTDPLTGLIYHLKYKPPPEDVAVRSRLVQRSDDTAEKIKIRYRDFTSNIDSVRELFSDRLIRVDGTKKSDAVGTAVISALDLVQKPKST